MTAGSDVYPTRKIHFYVRAGRLQIEEALRIAREGDLDMDHLSVLVDSAVRVERAFELAASDDEASDAPSTISAPQPGSGQAEAQRRSSRRRDAVKVLRAAGFDDVDVDRTPAEPEGSWCGRADHDADDCAREGCDR